jgi:hypothetical protein
MASACSALNASCPEIQLVALGYLAASLKRELLPVFPHDLVDAEGNRQSGVTGELPSNSSASKWEGGGSRGKTSSKKLAKVSAYCHLFCCCLVSHFVMTWVSKKH